MRRVDGAFGLPDLFLLEQGDPAFEFSKRVTELEMELIEGPSQLGYAFSTETKGNDPEWINEAFGTHIGRTIRAHYHGSEVFRGEVWTMQQRTRNTILLKDMGRLINAVRVGYEQEEATGEVYTDWQTNDESITQYGRMEAVVSINSTSEEEALGRAEFVLAEYAQPFVLGTQFAKTENPQLQVTVRGAMERANHIMLVPGGSTERVTISEEILRIVEVVQERGGYLYPLDIDMGNERTTIADVPSVVGAFDRLVELRQVPDDDGNHYFLRVMVDGGVIYNRLRQQYDYLFYPTRGLVTPDGEKPTWDGRPGVVRIMDNYGIGALPNTLFDDPRHVYMERVTMREGDEVCSFHKRQYDPLDVIGAIDANLRWVNQALAGRTHGRDKTTGVW